MIVEKGITTNIVLTKVIKKHMLKTADFSITANIPPCSPLNMKRSQWNITLLFLALSEIKGIPVHEVPMIVGLGGFVYVTLPQHVGKLFLCFEPMNQPYHCSRKYK